MLVTGRIYVDTTMRITVSFQDDDGNASDPDTVVFRTRSPCGTETAYTYLTDDAVARSSVGNFYADFVVNEPGRWFFRWETVGSDDATFRHEGNFLVQDSPFYDSWNSDYT